jgi:hypothetical protein
VPRAETPIDLAELEKLYGMQCTDEEVAAFFGVSKRTIQRRRKTKSFGEAADRAKAKGRVSVRRNLFRLANAGNVAAAIFLAKNLLGYRDVVSNEHSGPDGGPITIDNQVDMSRLTDEELNQLEALHRKAVRDGKT